MAVPCLSQPDLFSGRVPGLLLLLEVLEVVEAGQVVRRSRWLVSVDPRGSTEKVAGTKYTRKYRYVDGIRPRLKTVWCKK